MFLPSVSFQFLQLWTHFYYHTWIIRNNNSSIPSLRIMIRYYHTWTLGLDLVDLYRYYLLIHTSSSMKEERENDNEADNSNMGSREIEISTSTRTHTDTIIIYVLSSSWSLSVIFLNSAVWGLSFCTSLDDPCYYYCGACLWKSIVPVTCGWLSVLMRFIPHSFII
jgi:hypothetical protein